MNNEDEKSTVEVVGSRILNDATQFLLKTERRVWLPKFLCSALLIQEFEGLFAGQTRGESMQMDVIEIQDSAGERREERPSTSKTSDSVIFIEETSDSQPAESVIFVGGPSTSKKSDSVIFIDEPSTSKQPQQPSTSKPPQYEEQPSCSKSPSDQESDIPPPTAKIEKKRGKGQFTYYLVNIVTFSWLNENSVHQVALSSAISGQCETGTQTTGSQKEFRSAKIVARRVMNEKPQFLVKYERQFWMDKFLVDPQKIALYEYNTIGSFVESISVPSQDPSCEIISITRSPLRRSERNRNKFILWEIDLDKELERLKLKDNEVEYEERLNNSTILQKRVMNGSTQYLVHVENYIWIAEKYLDTEMIFDFTISTLTSPEKKRAEEQSAGRDLTHHGSLVELFKGTMENYSDSEDDN